MVAIETENELRSQWPHVLCTFRLSQPAKPLWVRSGRVNMSVWAGNLVPAPLHVLSNRLLQYLSVNTAQVDHSLAIFKGCPMGYHCHCQGLPGTTG